MDVNYMIFDIGGTAIKWAVANEFGDILVDGKLKVPKSIEEFFDVLANKVNELGSYNLTGIAISAPGAVNPETSVIGGSSAIPYIHGPNFRTILNQKTGLNVEIENDANCAALGECWLGAGKAFQDLAFVVCGTGIGGALVKSKRVHSGIHQHGGEFGYCIMDFNPNETAPNRFRTWSQVGSTVALVRDVARRKNVDVNTIDGVKVFELASQGDVEATTAIDLFYYYMAMGIFNIQYQFDPEIIVVGGAISERNDFLDQIESHLDNVMESIPNAKIRPRVAVNVFGNKANLLGALYNYLTRNKKIEEE